MGRTETGPERRVIRTPDAPAPVGAYSQGILADGWLWCAGQLPLDPASGELRQASPEEAAERCLSNLAAVAAAAGGSLADAVRLTVYLTNLAEFGAVDAVFARRFPEKPPARAVVEVQGLPKGARMEIDLVARIGK